MSPTPEVEAVRNAPKLLVWMSATPELGVAKLGCVMKCNECEIVWSFCVMRTMLHPVWHTTSNSATAHRTRKSVTLWIVELLCMTVVLRLICVGRNYLFA